MTMLRTLALALAALQAPVVLGLTLEYHLMPRDGNQQFPYCTFNASEPEACIANGRYVKPDVNISEPGSPGANAYNTYLPTHTYSLSLWTNGKMPSMCNHSISTYKYVPSSFSVYNVTYSDCSAPWVICRSNSAASTIQQLAEEISRIPASMRQAASAFLVFPETVGHAIQSWSDNGLIDGKSSYYHATGLVHELGHAVDSALLAAPIMPSYSDSSTWRNLVAADGFTATAYGTTSHAEGFTDIGRVVLLENIYPGGINSLFPNHPNLTQIARQVAHFQSVAGAYYQTGTTCDLAKKFPFPDLVNVAPPPTTTTPTSTATATPYGQCGGIEHTGPTMCGPGWSCTTLNPHYAQCTPAPAKRDFRDFSA
ncbi:hypothetical protein QBC39DRAFT_384032 [Podospora conica]|nr:hypothetical protein QBC39DRAFT_384032 [Schizothecium conicum]